MRWRPSMGSLVLGLVLGAAGAVLAQPLYQIVLLGVPTTVQGTLTTSVTGANNDLVFTSRVGGRQANRITIAYIDPGAVSQSLAVTVSGWAITVSLATSGAGAITSTAADITTAVAANTAAADLVTSANAGGNDGTGVVTAMSALPLTGAADVTALTATSGALNVVCQ